MRIEVNSAADFVMNLLRVKKANPQLSEVQLQHFKGSLEQILTRHFARHWYPDVPTKGSGFRCLRINGKMDPIIERAGHAAGLNEDCELNSVTFCACERTRERENERVREATPCV